MKRKTENLKMVIHFLGELSEQVNSLAEIIEALIGIAEEEIEEEVF